MPSKAATPEPQKTSVKQSKKRKVRADNEIDQLFEEKLGKKVKKAGLGGDATSQPAAPKVDGTKDKKRRKGEDEGKDKDLKDILGAIKAAPKDDKSHKRKKKA